MTKILITGSRNWSDKELINSFVLKFTGHDLIIHGGAKGVDSIIEELCNRINIETKIIRPVNPSIPSHYLYRNVEMITMCDKVIAFWDGESRGTKFTIDYAKSRNKEVLIIQKE